MIEKQITSANIDLPELQTLYESAFPIEEQIPFGDLKRLMQTMPLDFTAWYDDECFLGFTIVYRRPTVSWFWYFAVREELRGKGHGQQILQTLLEHYSQQPLILDMESPNQPAANQEQRRRRYGFYLRNGFRDTGVGKTFEGITYTILSSSNLPFTQANYEQVLNELRGFWKAMPSEEKKK